MNTMSDFHGNYEHTKEIKSVRWLLFGVILSLFAAEAFFEAIASFMSVPPHKYIRMAVVEIFAFLFPVILLKNSGLRKYSTPKSLCLNKIKGTDVFLIILLGIGGQAVMMLLNLPIQYISRVFFHTGDTVAAWDTSFWTVLGGIISVGILPAILEEYWMRGIVFGVYNKVSTKNAVLFTVFVFAVFHARPEELPGYIFMGFIAVFVMIKCNSLYAAVLYHLSSNLAALFFSIYIMDIVNVLWLIIALAVIVFAFVFLVFARRKSEFETVNLSKGTGLFKRSIVSLPIILSIFTAVLRFMLLNG